MSEYVEEQGQGPRSGLVEKRFFTFASEDEPFVLDSGSSIGPVTLAYETWGELSKTGDNAVLILHALTGDSHAAGFYSPEETKPGWWDIMIGPSKPIDTNRYFVICSNVLGGCMGSTGPASLAPGRSDAAKPYGRGFPVVTIADMVRAQRRLVESLGVKRLLSAVGGSMGGMQVLEWSLRYPGMLATAVPLAATARHTALNIAFNEIARQSIVADPNWNNGDYYDGPKPNLGLAVARMIGHVTYLSDEAMRRKFGRRLQDKDAFSYDFDADFQIESYLRHQGRKFVERFDANSFLYITKAADYFDLAERHGQGSLAAAFSKARARYLCVSFSSDWLYPTYQTRAMVKAMKKNGLDVTFCEIKADCGHDAFLLRNERLFDLVRNFLDNSLDMVRKGEL